MQQIGTLCQNVPMDEVTITAILALVSLVLWRIRGVRWITYPFQLFNTFTHELGHGIAALMTGGSFRHFSVNPDLTGEAWSAGGWRFFIASAGYTGSALAGAVMLVIAAWTDRPDTVLLWLGIIFGVLCLLFVRNAFGVVAAFGLTLFLIGAALLLVPPWSDYLLLFLSIQMILQALHSLFDLVQGSSMGLMHGSDAHALQAMTHIPAIFWAVLWTMMALGLLVLAPMVAYCPGTTPALLQWFQGLFG